MKISVFFSHLRQAAEEEGKSLREIIEEVKSYGVSGVELDLTEATDPQGLARAFERLEIGVSSICCTYDFKLGFDANREMAERHFRAALGVGCPRVMAVVGDYGYGDRNEEHANFLAATGEWARLAVKNTLTPMIEDFGTPVSPHKNADGVREFLYEIPQLRFNYDTGNFAFVGEDTAELAPEFAPVTCNVHCKDWIVASDGLKPCAVGDGDLRVRATIETLRESGYDGWFVIEQFGVKGMMRAIRRSAEFLLSL